ncbi:TadE/TadG family type IV pilus assembly protein [Acidimangrovimonas sediminis]|uniref:TadE/TadG family type IV pilus assembly protein n=1 Tax=Acidimangrovimonas sediminis TaxID=2056283 RepID=UPI000C7FB0AE|nr:TadE/TadG family type IV pilus assembly protein [Acidimangrovimonas sediminis]
MDKNMQAHPLLRPFKRFARDERGTILVETIIFLPVLIWAYLGMYVYFDAFSARNTGQRATYTVADLISRQTNTLTPTDIEGMNKIFDFITNADARGSTTRIRVTDVQYNYTTDLYEVVWSSATRTGTAMTDDDVNKLADSLPKPAQGDTEIVVESWATYTPAFDTIGVSDQTFHDFVVARPRMSPQVSFDASS